MIPILNNRFVCQINMLLIPVAVCFFALVASSYSEQECSAVTKIGTCPPTLINPGDKPCNSNLDCSGNRLCCYGSGITPRCSDPLQTKGNDCPDQENTQNGNTSCLLDSDCPGEEKCCPQSPCSYTCTAPAKKNELQIDFRQSCSVVIPVDARCPYPPILTSDAPVPCTSNSDCATNGNERMCCSDGNGGRQCAEPFTTRQGKCPPPTTMIVDAGSRCMLDTNCPGSQRCCASPLGCLICVQPNITSSQSGCFSVEKLGVCPALLTNEGRTACTDSSECYGNRVCCRRSFGTEKRCSDPFSTITGTCPTPGNIQLSQPQCLIDLDCPSGFKCCAVTNCSYYCAQVSTGQADPYFCGTSENKFGACPPAPINPTVFCQTNFECPGRQLCCNNMCSDALSNKRGTCPSPNQVSRGPSRCLVDGNCSGASNRKCCPDSNCNYYCTYTAV